MHTGTNAFELSPTFLLIAVAIPFGIATLLSFLTNHCSSGIGGTGTPGGGRAFLNSIIGIAMIYLFRALSAASVHGTGSGGNSGNGRYRWECLRSRKGGKRPFGDASLEYQHPCYDQSGTAGNNTDSSTSLCPSANNGDSGSSSAAFEPYISAARDCHKAQTKQCTLSQPCVPCELSRRNEFHASQHHADWSRCQSCSVRNNYGDCEFVDGVGPYCWENADGWNVVPCGQCCTERVPMIDAKGVCY